MQPEIIVVLVSCPQDRAEALAWALVEAEVAACVNIVPQVQSIYHWKGKVEQHKEALLIIKGPADDFDSIEEVVLKNHPYELPEIIAVNVTQGYPPYLQWVINTTS